MIFFLVLLFTVPLSAEPLAETQARFGVITGDVGLLSQGASEWIEPHEGLPLEPGDQIRTGEDGQVELILSENAVWMLEPETQAAAERMTTHEGRLALSSGTLLGKVDSARTAGIPQKWEFYTPVAVVAVRGTEFAIQVSRTEGTRLGVFEGEVDIQPAESAEGFSPPTRVHSGHEAFQARGRALQALSAFSPRMRTLSARREELRKRVGRVQRTWSPVTPAYRLELRRKFVVAPAKARPVRRPTRTAPARRPRNH